MHPDRHFVYGREVEALDDAVAVHVAEARDFVPEVVVEIVLRPQYYYVGLHSHPLQLVDGVLGRFGLELACSAQVRDVGEVDADYLLLAFPPELPDCLDEGLALDVAYGAAYLGDHEVIFTGLAQPEHAAFDFVGDVGYDLDGLAEVVAAALFFDDVLVYAAGGDVVGLAGAYVGETLVVAQVEVGLEAVAGDVAFTVLVWVECARIYVDVGIEFLDGYPESPGLQEFAY